VVEVDATPVKMNVAVVALLAREQLIAAREDDVGCTKQRRLARRQVRRCEPEVRELVHAVVDDGDGVELPEHCGRDHRRIEPMNSMVEAAGEQRMLTERALQVRQYRRALRIDVQLLRVIQHRHDAHDVRIRFAHCDARLASVRQRLFDEGDAMMSGEPDEDLLRPLPDEVPAQVAMSDDRQIVRYV
jgi:hypothetical protein